MGRRSLVLNTIWKSKFVKGVAISHFFRHAAPPGLVSKHIDKFLGLAPQAL